MSDIVSRLKTLPVIRAALAEDDAALVRRREALLARKSQAEVDGARAHEALKAAVVFASKRRLKAWEAYLVAEGAEAAASAAADGHHHQNQVTISRINGELRASAPDIVTAAAELARQLRIEHSRLRMLPVGTHTEIVARTTRDGDVRRENLLVADVGTRAAELAALRDAARDVEELVLNVADPAEIVSTLTALRARFGLPEGREEVAA